MPVKREGKLNNLKTRLENAQRKAGIESGMVVAQRAQGNAPVDKGRLKRSITHGEPTKTGRGGMRTEVGPNVEYAAAQEFGTGIHAEKGPKRPIAITPKNASVLAFQWPNAPAGVRASQAMFPLVFFKSVTVQGVKPQPYLRPALEDSRDIILAIHRKNIARAMVR